MRYRPNHALQPNAGLTGVVTGVTRHVHGACG